MTFDIDHPLCNWANDALPKLTAFGSDLGLTAKYVHENGWPASFTDKSGRGNGLDLLAVAKKVQDGDLLYVRYRQVAGCLDLVIYND